MKPHHYDVLTFVIAGVCLAAALAPILLAAMKGF